jgi:hypothetical protein
MSLAAPAIEAVSAAWYPIEGHPVTNSDPLNIRADGNYFAGAFMA